MRSTINIRPIVVGTATSEKKIYKNTFAGGVTGLYASAILTKNDLLIFSGILSIIRRVCYCAGILMES